jgi:hypothetical protein
MGRETTSGRYQRDREALEGLCAAGAQFRNVYGCLTGGICLEGMTDSDREAVVTENQLCGTLVGLRATQEVVENVSIEVDTRRSIRGRVTESWGSGTADHREVLSVIGE